MAKYQLFNIITSIDYIYVLTNYYKFRPAVPKALNPDADQTPDIPGFFCRIRISIKNEYGS